MNCDGLRQGGDGSVFRKLLHNASFSSQALITDDSTKPLFIILFLLFTEKDRGYGSVL